MKRQQFVVTVSIIVLACSIGTFAQGVKIGNGVKIGGGSGLPAGPTSPNGVASIMTSTPSGGIAGPWLAALSGVVPRASACPSNIDTVLATDRAGYVSWNDAAACAVTLPQANSTGFNSNFVFTGCDIGAGAASITPTPPSTISFSNGTSYTSAASSVVLNQGQCIYVYSDNANYFATFIGAATTSSVNVMSDFGVGNSGGANIGLSAAGTTKGVGFIWPRTGTYGHVCVWVNVADGVNNYEFGFVSADGTTLLAHTTAGVISGTREQCFALNQSVTLTSGVEYVWAASAVASNTAQFSPIAAGNAIAVFDYRQIAASSFPANGYTIPGATYVVLDASNNNPPPAFWLYP